MNNFTHRVSEFTNPPQVGRRIEQFPGSEDTCLGVEPLVLPAPIPSTLRSIRLPSPILEVTGATDDDDSDVEEWMEAQDTWIDGFAALDLTSDEPLEITKESARFDDVLTVEMPPIALKTSPPSPSTFLVEVHAPRRRPSIFGVRPSLEAAQHLAETVHPAVADVLIREMPLPSDLAADVWMFAKATWRREPNGKWFSCR